MTFTTFLKSLPQLAVVLVSLTAVAVLTTQNVVSGGLAYGFVGLIIGATAVAGSIVLSGPQTNSNLLPHLVVLLAVIGYVTALAYTGYFTGAQVIGTFSVLVGGAAVGYGSNSPTAFALRRSRSTDGFSTPVITYTGTVTPSPVFQSGGTIQGGFVPNATSTSPPAAQPVPDITKP